MNKPVSESVFQYSCIPQACHLIEKESITQVLSFKIWKIFKSTFFIEHLWAIAFVLAPSLLHIS